MSHGPTRIQQHRVHAITAAHGTIPPQRDRAHPDDGVAAPDWVCDVVASLQPLVTVAEAARALRMSERNLRRLIVAGRIVRLRARESGSSRVLIPRREIERYLRSLRAE